jgi:cytochrome P450
MTNSQGGNLEASGVDESGPICQITTPTGDVAWLVRSHEAVKGLISDPRLTRGHPDPERAPRYTRSAMFDNPPLVRSPEEERETHARFRRLLTASFSSRRMGRMRPLVQGLVDGLLDDMAETGPPADLHEALAYPLPVLVICELLGVPSEDRQDFRRWAEDASHMMDAARSRSGFESLRRYMSGLVELKRDRPAEDVISDLIAAADREEWLRRPGVVEQVATRLLFAGHATTVKAIDSGLVLLLTSDAQRQELQQDPALLGKAVEEILRVGVPVPLMPRYANADIDAGDVTIRAGELVLLGLQVANGDEHVFEEPERFDIRRPSNDHMTFGNGVHYCLGSALARMELQVVLGTVLERFPTLRLAVPASELRYRDELLVGALVELPVVW